MKTRSRLPLPRLGHDGLLAAAGAAGYAPACAYESGGEWDAALLERGHQAIWIFDCNGFHV